jgi:hypothetical protein
MNEKTLATVADSWIERAVSSSGDLFSAASKIIVDGVTEYGPMVVDSVLWVVRIDALQDLILSWLIVGFIVFAAAKLFKTVKDRKERFYREDTMRWSNWEAKQCHGTDMVLAFASVAIALIIFCVSPASNVWKYVAVVKPEFYLVKKTIDLVEIRLKEKSK